MWCMGRLLIDVTELTKVENGSDGATRRGEQLLECAQRLDTKLCDKVSEKVDRLLGRVVGTNQQWYCLLADASQSRKQMNGQRR
jgi:hypothetical protein